MYKNIAISAIMIQNFFFGIVYYTYVYYLPIYFQNVRQWSALRSAVLTIPMVGTQALTSILSGQYISVRQHYGEVILSGFLLFTLGTGLTILFDQDLPVRYIVAILIVFGVGSGNVFQPTIVALQAHARKSQRAVVISNRNFIRAMGGAIGLALSAAVLQNVLKASLPPQFKFLAVSSYTRPDYATFSPSDGAAIKAAYAKASRAVFIVMCPLAGLCLLTCAFVKDHGLIRPEEREAMERQKAEETARRQQEPDIEKGVSGGVAVGQDDRVDENAKNDAPEQESTAEVARERDGSDVEKSWEPDEEKPVDLGEALSRHVSYDG